MLEERPSANKPANPQSSSAEGTGEGLPLEEYAASRGLTEAEVWRRLRQGDLVGRTNRGRLFVYSTEAAVPAGDEPQRQGATFGAWIQDHELHQEFEAPAVAPGGALPPLPHHPSDDAARAGATSGGGFLALTGERTSSPEMALLLDHLSLAKEENREILRLTQDSLRKVTDLTDKIVEMKDQVIDAKDAQIMALMQQLEAKDQKIKKLAKQNEDLEMLARTMAEHG